MTLSKSTFGCSFCFSPASSPNVIPMESYLQIENSKPAECEVFLLLTEKQCSFSGGILMATSHFVECSGNSAAEVLISFFQRKTMNFFIKFQIACLFK